MLTMELPKRHAISLYGQPVLLILGVVCEDHLDRVFASLGCLAWGDLRQEASPRSES